MSTPNTAEVNPPAKDLTLIDHETRPDGRDMTVSKTSTRLDVPEPQELSDPPASVVGRTSNGIVHTTSPTLLTLPLETRFMILQNLLDVNRAHQETRMWTPVPEDVEATSQTLPGYLPGDTYVYDSDQDDPGEEEEDQELYYFESADHGGVPSFRKRALHLEVIFTCRQLNVEGTAVLSKNKLIEVSCWSFGPAGPWCSEPQYRHFPLWPQDSAYEEYEGVSVTSVDRLLRISRADVSRIEPATYRYPQATVLIAPRDLPDFMRYTGHMRSVSEQEISLSFPQTTSPRDWGFPDDASFWHFMSESMRPRNTEHAPGTRVPSSTGPSSSPPRDAEHKGPDWRGKLEQWVSTLGGTIPRPSVPQRKDEAEKSWLVGGYYIHLNGPNGWCALLSRMLEDAETLLREHGPSIEASTVFHEVMHRCGAAGDRWSGNRFSTGEPRTLATYAWCCWRLATIDGCPTERYETDTDRRNRLRWAYLYASQAFPLPAFVRTRREWEARLRLRRVELKLLLQATDHAIQDELFHVAMAAAPDNRRPPAVSESAQHRWARAFVRPQQEGRDVQVSLVRELVIRTFGEEIQRTQDVVLCPKVLAPILILYH